MEDDLETETKFEDPGNSLHVDSIAQIFALTLGSLKGAGGMVLWCWVYASQMSMGPQAIPTILMAIYFGLLCIIKGCVWMNARIRDGSNWVLTTNDEILLTGGSSGLGLLVAAMLGSTGFSITSLDVSVPQIPLQNVKHIQCDVGKLQEVERAVHGMPRPPAVVICCAGTNRGTMGTFARLKVEDVDTVLRTNVMGSMNVVHSVLRKAKLKMIVGVSSSTAIVAPARAGVYAASKAAIRVWLESLRHELPATRVLSVTPGQLDTAMFADVQTPSKFWAPVARAADIATQIHDAIIHGRQGELTMPFYAQLLPYVLLLPQSLVDFLRDIIGVDSAVPLK